MAPVTSIPVFVYPTSIKFHLNGKTNHKKLMTIYNPFDISLKFNITCTAPSKYIVVDPNGYIGPKSSYDVIIKYAVPAISNCGTVDKFRVTVCDAKTQRLTGKQDVESILLEYEDEINMENQRDFHSLHKGSNSSISRDRSIGRDNFLESDINKTKKMFVLILAALALSALAMLPLKETGETNDFVPDYLHLSSLSKIGLSFLIGAISSYYLFSFHERSQIIKCDLR